MPHAPSDFELFVGVDYSGAKTATSRLRGLQVYAARPGVEEIERWSSPVPSNNRQRANWTRRELAERLRDEVRAGKRLLIGIDHCFSFPLSYFDRYGLKSWPAFLADFTKHWPTHMDGARVSDMRDRMLNRQDGRRRSRQRVGSTDELRLTERWTSAAKCVFLFGVPGSVATSSHAGIPWLLWLRQELGHLLHFWPFDGWAPPSDKAVIAEVYPSILRKRYPPESRTADEHDAYAAARWMADMAGLGELAACFRPPLTPEEMKVAALEGWILGVR